MKRRYIKRILSLLMTLCIVISGLPALTITVNAGESDDKTSMEIAGEWGFDTSQPESSKEREALGENPIKAYEDTVTIFGEVPLEIAVVGSNLSLYDDYRIYNEEERGDIYYYDNMEAQQYSHKLKFGNGGGYNNVRDITWASEKDVRPATTIAADMDGDGVDEIVRYFIDINYNGSDIYKRDGDIKEFNAGVEGYSADFRLQCINSQTGTNIDRLRLRTVTKTAIPDFFIPDSIYYWSSYMQMTSGDYDGDGKEEIAIAVPGSSRNYGNIYIYGMEGGKFVQEYSSETIFYSCFGGMDNQKQFTAIHLASGDADNDKIDELIYTHTRDLLTVDENSTIRIIDYKNGAYSSGTGRTIKFGNNEINEHLVGNAGVTVGDIDNDGLNEVIVGGFMVNKNEQDAMYTYTKEDGTTKEFKYYHELAMSYMEYDKNSKAYGNFKGFTVLRDDENMAWTAAGSSDTKYNDNPALKLSSCARYRNAQNWTIPIQSVSLTGYVNGRTNDQIFFGNCMYYYDAGSGKFKVYDDSSKVDNSTVVYNSFDAPVSVITSLIPGSFLDPGGAYVKSEGREQLLISYAGKNSLDHNHHFEIAMMYESSAGASMDVQKKVNYLARTGSDDFYQLDFYPTVCAPNMDNDAVFVQYIGYAFTYSKPEILTVLASIPYYEDIYNAYPMWEPGSTYLSKSSGSSQTDIGFTEFSLGWYLSFEQDISVFGLKIASFEVEANVSANTSHEYSHTVERESSVTYETNGGQDSVVMVSSPLDMYYYRYYEENKIYKTKYPNAVKSDPTTWGTMAVSLPGAPQTLVFPVERYNEFAEYYDMDIVDSNFWIHISGDPGTYPTSVNQFKNADNILSSDSSISAISGSGSVTTELTISESTENAYTVSLTMGARVGAGAGGFTMGVAFENTLGFGGAKAGFKGTTIGATILNFPCDDYDTSKYSLTTRLHSYVTEFNGKNIMVLYYTVSQVMGLPKLPDNFHVTDKTARSISLAWEVPEIISYALKPNNFELHRYDNYYKKWFVLDDNISVQSGINSYTDTDVYPSEVYKYRLIAEDITGSRTNSVTLEASTLPTGAPPIIVVQPRDTKAGTGYSAVFSIEAELPENIDPARLYYQWYQRQSDGDSWSVLSGANEKTLTLSGVSMGMNGYQYYCEVTRLINNSFPLTASSAVAKLTVTEQPPSLYTINYSAGINGSISALEAAYGGNYDISSGSRLYEQTKVEFTANPKIGYRVNKWTINEIPVDMHTGNKLTIDSLSEDITVNVSFTYSTYDITFDIAENEEEGQDDAVWGSISAKYADTYVLPQGEATSVAAQMPITFTASPAIIGDIKYTVKKWIVNGETVRSNNGSIFIGKTYTIEALSEDTVVEVMFAKSMEYSLSISSEVSNTNVAYFDNGAITVRDDGALVQNGDTIEKGSRVTIDVVPPSSSLIYSWEITPVDDNGNAVAPATVLGSQSSYVLDELSSSYVINITYVIISTKTVTFGFEGGKGTVTANVGVRNTLDTGTVISGGKVQMYSDTVFTAHPDNDILGVKGWTVNGIYETNTDTSVTLKGINRNTTVKVLFETAPEAKDSIAAVEISAEESAVVDADALAYDIDGDSLIVSGIRTPPEAGTAAVTLGKGENDGKAIITGVNKGEERAVLTVSDGKGHNCDVSIPIKVSNNSQKEPDGLNGIGPTLKNGNNGKITGLIAGNTYQYKEATSGSYTKIVATEQICEISGLTAGTYLVRYAAVAGYDAGKSTEVVVPQYVPKSIAYLDILNYKVGAAAETKVPDFDKDTVAYNVELDYGVENDTEIILFGIPAEGSGAVVTESVYRILEDGIATANITVTSEDEISNKTYTVYFIKGKASNSEARILEFKIKVNGITAVGIIDDAAKTIAVTVPKGTDVRNLAVDYVLSNGATCLTKENDFTNPVSYTIKAEDGTKEEYTVTVTEAENEISYYNLNIGVDKNCEGMGRVIGGGSYEAGQEVTIAAFSETGYKFKVWEVVYGELDTIDIWGYSNTFKMPAIDGIIINALFEAKDDPSIKPTTESFDKYDNDEEDKLCKGTVSFTIDEGDYEFTGITGMTENVDYEVTVNLITILNSTLQSMEPGLHNMIFNFSEGKKASATLEISDSKPVVYSVIVNPATAIVTQGKTKKFSAVIRGENCGSVTWSVAGKGEDTDTNISAEGLLTVDVNEAEGTVLTVRATSDIDNRKSGTAKVTIIGKVDAVRPEFFTDLDTAVIIYNEGETAAELTVKATVTDEGTVRYQWYENTEKSTEGGTIIEGADSASYTPPTEIAGIKYYYVVATNENLEATGNTTASETSSIIPVKVEVLVHAAAPEISAIKGKRFYKQGDSISTEDMLKIIAVSPDGGNISYKWYLKAAEEGDPDILLDGENEYYIPSTAVEGKFTYYVAVTNTNNHEKITGNTIATVTSELIEVNVTAVINAAQPYFKDGGNLSGTIDYPVGSLAASLMVEATADDLTTGGSLSYQWYVNTAKSTEGGIMVGTDSASFTPDISGLGVDTTRYYYVVVTNTNDTVNGIKSASITSGIKTICIKDKIDAAAPVFEQQNSGNYTYYKGAKANSLEVYAVSDDGGSISYQWYRNSINSNTGGEAITDETDRIYRPSTDIIGTTYYYVVATNTNTGVNGRQITTVEGEVSTIRIVQPEYKGITVKPIPITGVAYGTAATATAFGLPDKISINISIDGITGTDTAFVTWDLTGYNTSKTAAQTFNTIGTINLPTGVVNTGKFSLEVVVIVSVKGKPSKGGNGGSGSGGSGGSSGGGGGGKGGGPSSGSSPTTNLPDTEIYTNVQGFKISAAVDSNTKAVKVELDREILDKAYSNTKAGKNGEKTIAVEMPASESETYNIGFPIGVLTYTEKDKNIVINTDIANLTIPNTMLTGTGYENSKQTVVIIKKGNKDMLPQVVKDKLGDKPLIELGMIIDGKQQSWDNADAPVTISMSYTPTPEELKDPEHISVWYIDGAGNIVSVPSGRYDQATGMVTFTTTHFSYYAIAYVQKTFSDLGSHVWAKKQIEVLTSKGVISTIGKSFTPGTGITRADYLMMLVRALGLSAEFTANFDDVKPGDYYFKEIGTARKLGITSGIGNNKFNPSATITRQDMMTLTERALRKLKIISREGSTADLETFSDKDSIAEYAKNCIATLIREGLVEGFEDRINPLSDTTRAEAAVFIYRIYNIR